MIVWLTHAISYNVFCCPGLENMKLPGVCQLAAVVWVSNYIRLKNTDVYTYTLMYNHKNISQGSTRRRNTSVVALLPSSMIDISTEKVVCVCDGGVCVVI
eukprot:GHVQ01041701.1.p1 GENE.GHVQ01041701.1~~GHVQ01041701.1.p1  ORF type:complete len:100 (+),score=9.66 GHVQ01041701.1:233-532(+)